MLANSLQPNCPAQHSAQHSLPITAKLLSSASKSASSLRLTKRLGASTKKPDSAYSQQQSSVFKEPKKLSRVREDDEGLEIPQTGWLWQANKRGGGGQRDGPSAMATVANLKADRVKAKKSLGQNFLTDDKILLEIAQAAAVRPGDMVLEVGPGTGNLTKHLLSRGALVTSIEKDDVLFARLSEEYAQEERLRIVHGDVLRWNLPHLVQEMQQRAAWHRLDDPQQQTQGQGQQGQGQEQGQGAMAVEGVQGPGQQVQLPVDGGAAGDLAQQQQQGLGERWAHDEEGAPARARVRRLQPHGSGLKNYGPPSAPKIKVVANLPYNITKEFLKKMLPMGDVVSELSIMIQQEAAVRLVDSTPGSNDFRAMNLYVQLYSNPVYRFRISRFKYDPVPGVDGALVTFKLLPPAQRLKLPGGQGGERKFMQLVYRGFDQRRKMLRNSLQPAYTPAEVEAALTKVGLSTRTRAQELSLAQHVALAHALEQAVLGSAKDLAWRELVEGHQCNLLSCEEMSIDEDDD